MTTAEKNDVLSVFWGLVITESNTLYNLNFAFAR